MKHVLAVALIGSVASVACGPKRSSGPTRPSQALVVLLPDQDTGRPGRASVANPYGSVTLAAARDSTIAWSNRAPDAVRTLSEAEVTRVFGDALSALPPAVRHFTLNFRFDSDELTDESRAMLREVISAVRQRAAPDISIVGHTDTAGAPAANIQLGLRRATTVRALLVADGLDVSVDVTSHGEADPLIPTPNNTTEPRNRRVEITVR